jgi:DNA-binding HxlR family transcriptional regulator
MTRTHKNVSHLLESKYEEPQSPDEAAIRVQKALKSLEGRWKLQILFQLFDGEIKRFSELERALPGVSQKMLTQQLRKMEHDGMVAREIHAEVPPRVEYRLTEWGQTLCPVLDLLLRWDAQRPEPSQP